MHSLSNLHVVVTGGTGALGRAVVTQFLEADATVHVPAYSVREAESVPFRDHERFRIETGLDLTVEETVERYYANLPSLYASVHIAGGFKGGSITDSSLDDFSKLLKLNAVTCFLCCREAVRVMRRGGGGGRIVNVTAKPALEPSSGVIAYASSKAAVASMTRCLAEEVADEGILVNAIAPSVIDTPANRAAMPDADHSRWPKVDELASSILHLASPANASVRGSILAVFGRS